MFPVAMVTNEQNQFIPMLYWVNAGKEDMSLSKQVPFRSYITLTSSMECQVKNIPFKMEDCYNKAGWVNEFIGEWIEGWRRGGPNINCLSHDDISNVGNNYNIKECGITFPTTVRWESYGKDLSSQVKPPFLCCYSLKHITVLPDDGKCEKEGTDPVDDSHHNSVRMCKNFLVDKWGKFPTDYAT